MATGFQSYVLRMPVEMHRRLKRAAAKADLQMSQWIRQAINEKLERER